jgi:flagellar hook-associated protein 2
MSINFGGLATGMDTEAIISALMNIERAPIRRLENDKAFYNNRLNAFSELETKLKALMEKAEDIDTFNELNTPTAKLGAEGYFTASASSAANLGSYQIEVIEMAQLQKDVSQGYADKSAKEFGTGAITLTVGGTPTPITIDTDNNSLEGIAAAINDADAGVTASIINDGTANPYRLVLSGDTVSDTFSLDLSGLSVGTYATPTMTNTQAASQAHIQVDNIDIYSDTNTFDGAIAGVTLDILKKDPTVSTTLTVSSNPDASKQKVKDFANAYNDIMNYMADQADADWGNDSSFRAVKRRLQDMLTTAQVGGTGTFSTLSEIGFETQRDGTILVNDSILSDALDTDFSGVISLFAGEAGVDGITKSFIDYLDAATDSIDGFYATRKESNDSNIRRIDQRIENLEVRMESRERVLRAQFTAMEELVSAMNSQGSYLAQQMASMPTIGGNS